MPAILIAFIIQLLTKFLVGQPAAITTVIIPLAEKILTSVTIADLNNIIGALKISYGDEFVDKILNSIKSEMPDKEVKEIFDNIGSYSP